MPPRTIQVFRICPFSVEALPDGWLNLTSLELSSTRNGAFGHPAFVYLPGFLSWFPNLKRFRIYSVEVSGLSKCPKHYWVDLMQTERKPALEVLTLNSVEFVLKDLVGPEGGNNGINWPEEVPGSWF